MTDTRQSSDLLAGSGAGGLVPDGPTSALVPLPSTAEGWVCRTISLTDDDELHVRLEATTGLDLVQVWVAKPGAADERVFRRLRHCVVRYGGRLQRSTADARAAVGRLVNGLGEMVDARLDASPGATIAEALGRSRSARRVAFGAEMLRALLEPAITVGRPLADGWVLHDIYAGSGYSTASGHKPAIVLDFRTDDAQRLTVQIGPRDDSRAAFAHTPHLTVVLVTLGREPPASSSTICALVSFMLQLSDHEGLDIVFGEDTADAPPALLTAGDEPTEEPGQTAQINVSIERDCGQDCVFCSVREQRPPTDDLEAELAKLRMDLTQARRQGIRSVRFNGYDPLALPRILDVMELSTRLGFTSAEVYSPCTLLADEAFCDAVLGALPEDTSFLVPLYGGAAEVHDRCTGVPGSFDKVVRAIDNLLARLEHEHVRIACVVTHHNVDHLDALAAFAEERAIACKLHLPFPSTESPLDRYAESAARQTDVAESLARSMQRSGRRLWVRGLAPCIAFDRFSALGLPPRAYLGYFPDQEPVLPGTEYRDERFVHHADFGDQGAFQAAAVPCPHAGRCALRTLCPGEILKAYAARFGLDELHPVTVAELLGR